MRHSVIIIIVRTSNTTEKFIKYYKSDVYLPVLHATIDMLTEGIGRDSLSLKKTIFKYICGTDDRIPFLKVHFNNNMDNYDWKEISLKILRNEYNVSHRFVEMFRRKLDPEISRYLQYALTENDDIPEDCIHRMLVMEEEDYDENNVNDSIYYQNIPNSILLKYRNIIDWRSVSRYQKLSENKIDMFASYVHWPYISIYQKFSQSFVEKYMYMLSWSNVSLNLLIDEEILVKNANKLNWLNIGISKRQLSEEFIRNYRDDLHMKFVSSNQKLSVKFMDEIFEYLDTDIIAVYQKLNEDFIIKHFDRFNITLVFCHQHENLSDEFIEKYQDKCEWDYFCTLECNDEKIIEKYYDKFDKKSLCTYQNLSEEFILKHFDDLDMVTVIEYQKVSENILRKYIIVDDENNISPNEKYVFISDNINNIDEIEQRVREFSLLKFKSLPAPVPAPSTSTQGGASSATIPIVDGNYFIFHKGLRKIPPHVWTSICVNQKLSEKFILEFFHKMDFKIIFKTQTLSYPFINKYYRFGDLSDILLNQKVDENFVDEIYKHNNTKNYINWDAVCMYLKLTQPFIEKHIQKLNFNYVLRYQKLPIEFIEKNTKRITTKLKGWDILAKYQKLSYEFIMENSVNLNYVLLVLYQKHLRLNFDKKEQKLMFRKTLEDYNL